MSTTRTTQTTRTTTLDDDTNENNNSEGDDNNNNDDVLFEVDAINLEITRCELALLRHERYGKRRDDERRRPKQRRWMNSNATVYRKPNERGEREVVLDEKKCAFSDVHPVNNNDIRRRQRPRVLGNEMTTKTNRHSLEEILRKAVEEKQSTCTFRPETIAKAFTEEDVERRKARRERLLQSRLDIVRAREAAKREAEKAAFEKECTFRPKILGMKNKKEELFLAYFDASEEMKQIKQEQKILIGICSFLFILTIF